MGASFVQSPQGGRARRRPGMPNAQLESLYIEHFDALGNPRERKRRLPSEHAKDTAQEAFGIAMEKKLGAIGNAAAWLVRTVGSATQADQRDGQLSLALADLKGSTGTALREQRRLPQAVAAYHAAQEDYRTLGNLP